MYQDVAETVGKCPLVYVYSAQWESAQPNLDLPNIEARSEMSA